MHTQSLYFTDNFFSSGKTVIYNESKESAGELDLKSAFSQSVDVVDVSGKVIITGKFRVWGNKWLVLDGNQTELGELKKKAAFFAKKFEYSTGKRGIFRIESESFSKQYDIYDASGVAVAKFEKVNGFFSSAAYQLTSYNSEVPPVEWVAVIMGVNAIIKRERAAD